MTEKSEPIIIKKYANRRLYDTSASRYVTLDHLRDLVKAGKDFQVVDATAGEDLTRAVLGQIIFEQESKGENLLPVEFLRQVISFYGDSMQGFVPDYLRMTMDALARQQETLREKFSGSMGRTPAMAMMEEQAKRNMAMFEQAMSMFSPFSHQGAADSGEAAKPEGEGADREEVRALRAELEAMRAKLDKLAGQ